RLHGGRLGGVVEADDQALEALPARPGDAREQRPARRQLVERAQRDALGQREIRPPAGVLEGTGDAQDARPAGYAEGGVAADRVVERRAIGEPDPRARARRVLHAGIPAHRPRLADQADEPIGPLRPQPERPAGAGRKPGPAAEDLAYGAEIDGVG